MSIVAASQQSFLRNSLLTHTSTHKPNHKSFSHNTLSISCNHYSHHHDNDNSTSRGKNNGNQFAKLAMVALAAGVLTLGSVDPASAAKSGGRVGGQAFRSAPRPSSPRPNNSKPNNSRTNIYINPGVAPPLGGYGYGGYGYGYGWSPFSFFAPGPSVAVGVGGGFDTMFLFIFLGAAAAVVRKFFSSRNDEDDDY